MKPIRLRGKLKGIFFRMRLDVLFGPFANLLVFMGYITKLSKWIQKNKNLEFSDYYSWEFNYSRRLELFRYVIDKEGLDSNIDYLEFGVSKGNSFRWWAQNIKNQDARFYGFDTFTGLPEDWGPFKKGDMSNDNAPPVMDDKRCTFYQGLFQQTLPDFLRHHDLKRRTVIHMDADIYTATLFVLTSIHPYLKKGDILLFDEFNVPMHEFKAFYEWVNSFYVKYEVLGSVNNFYQVAIKIK